MTITVRVQFVSKLVTRNHAIGYTYLLSEVTPLFIQPIKNSPVGDRQHVA